jgi:hypothetical protein
MLKEIQDSLTTTVKERISSPILGTFSLLFAAFHWRFLVHLIWHESKGSQLIAELEKLRPYGFKSYFWPVFLAIAFAIIYPLIKIQYTLFLSWLELSQTERRLRHHEARLILEKRNRDLTLFIEAQGDRLKSLIADGNIPDDFLKDLERQFGKIPGQRFEMY